MTCKRREPNLVKWHLPDRRRASLRRPQSSGGRQFGPTGAARATRGSADGGPLMNRARAAANAPVRITIGNRLLRMCWSVAWLLLYRPTPVPLHFWRRALLRLFGARIGKGAHPYPAARIWAPWNLTLHDHSCIANDVDCYCVAPVEIGDYATISQYSYLCTASHEFRQPGMPLVAAAIVIERHAWVAAGAFIGPGVRVAEGAVVGARATVVHDVPAWTVVAGNPARVVGTRPNVATE
jgi:putative colanic acid biosynthesis acetyltransferase WcaF